MKTMFNLNRFLILLLGASVMLMTACVEDPDNEEEEIDTVELVFTNGPTVTWKVGSTTTPEITLDANTTYAVAALFRNEEEGEDVTAEIREEDDEHIVCYEVSGGANVTINRIDSDGNFEIGLATSWETGDASTGTMILKLRHQPGVKDGTCTPGESDVEVDFNITIQ